MTLSLASLKALSQPKITSRRQLVSYVVVTTLMCVTAALAFDVVNQLTFFEGWPATVRSWSVTVLIALVIAAPTSWLIGRAHFELNRAKREAEILSRTDPLTGLPNRRAIFEQAENMRGRAMVLVVLDIDRFKRVNDTHGHLAGDEVIVALGRVLMEIMGPLGTVGRIGGDEFMLIAALGEIERVVEALTTLRLRSSVLRIAHGENVTVTISAGAAASEADGDLDALFRDADRALYEAKARGRNLVVYSPSFERLRDRIADRDHAKWREDAASDSWLLHDSVDRGTAA